MTTEHEAKDKRCCGPEDCGEEGKNLKRFCIGSACMAWHWVYALDDSTHPSGGNERRTNSGYCGLAARP